MHYNINLIRTARLEEKKAERKRLSTMILVLCCFGILLLSLFYTGLQILFIENKLAEERNNLERIKNEYSRYKATKTIIDKSDIELLDTLQHDRIFWTKKLVAMAQFLPENYWITQFGFNKSSFDVDGYGYITKEQEQLITMDDYLNQLRSDTTFNDVFDHTYLNSTERKDEKTRERINFKYSAVTGTKGRQRN